MEHVMNKHLRGIDQDMCDHDEPLKSEHFTQIYAATNSIMDEMCDVSGAECFGDLQTVHLNNRNINKNKLCEWLETVCAIVNDYCTPVLMKAESISQRVDQLKEEKISDQSKIIQLQDKLIEKTNESLDLECVKATKNIIYSLLRALIFIFLPPSFN